MIHSWTLIWLIKIAALSFQQDLLKRLFATDWLLPSPLQKVLKNLVRMLLPLRLFETSSLESDKPTSERHV